MVEGEFLEEFIQVLTRSLRFLLADKFENENPVKSASVRVNSSIKPKSEQPTDDRVPEASSEIRQSMLITSNSAKFTTTQSCLFNNGRNLQLQVCLKQFSELCCSRKFQVNKKLQLDRTEQKSPYNWTRQAEIKMT